MRNFKLDENSKIQTGFSIPENYFENFDLKISGEMRKKEVKVISIFQKSKYWISAIAAILVVGLFFTFLNKNQSEENIANEDFLTSQTDLSTEDLVEHLTENDIKILEENLNVYDQETINSIKENL